MAKFSKLRRKTNSRRHQATPYAFSSCSRNVFKNVLLKKRGSRASEKKHWKDATCSVCLEYPHNAVLLLCSSYDKGCRAYMCATGHRYSNCLEQYKKAYTKVTPIQSSQHWTEVLENSSLSSGLQHQNEKMEVPELLCPLCRGQVKGWTVVEPARKYLNAKKRTCMLDDCSFVGSYKALRKHVRTKHPLACPRAVDPILEEKWKSFEREREQNDVISTIISSTPGAVVLGDYVIEPNFSGSYSDYDSDLDDSLDGALFRLASFNRGQNRGIYSRGSHRDLFNVDFGRRSGFGFRPVASYGQGLLVGPGRSRRQWRHRRTALL